MATKIKRYCIQLPGHWSETIKELAHENRISVTQQIQRSLEASCKSAGIPLPSVRTSAPKSKKK